MKQRAMRRDKIQANGLEVLGVELGSELSNRTFYLNNYTINEYIKAMYSILTLYFEYNFKDSSCIYFCISFDEGCHSGAGFVDNKPIHRGDALIIPTPLFY